MSRKSIIPGKIKGYHLSLSAIFVILLILWILGYFSVEIVFTNKEVSVGLIQLIWTVIISFIGLYLFLWTERDEAKNYLHLNVSIIDEGMYKKIRTELNNPTKFDRKIEYSFILITKHGDNIESAIYENLDMSFKHTNDFYLLKGRTMVFNRHFAFIPLDYYTKENIHVGNEKLVYEQPILNDNSDEFCFYDVRFFVYRSPNDANPYHRSVVACFGMKGNLIDPKCNCKSHNISNQDKNRNSNQEQEA